MSGVPQRDRSRDAVDAVANAIWPLVDLSTDEARDELRRDVRRGLATLVALARDGDEWVSGHDLIVRVGALVVAASDEGWNS